MNDKWRPYLCNVNGNLASIFVDLGLRDEVPIRSKPWLLWIWVYFQQPRPDGLSSSEEAPTLFKIEDALNAEISQRCRGIPCGRITTDGRREFYFYAETNIGLGEAVAAALANFEGYRFDKGEQEDPRWNQYLNVLYPSEEDLQRIGNRDVLEKLEEQGDVLTVPREVVHWLYFRSETSRSLFRQAATKGGFRVVSESRADGDLLFGISIARTQTVDQDQIDKTVVDLLHLAQRFEGDYDGWESPVVTQ
jgi:regulator of RNase E activity RraB